jgi:hypothetical protein
MLLDMASPAAARLSDNPVPRAVSSPHGTLRARRVVRPPKDVPFERRAKFLHDSICRYPDSTDFDAALSEQAADIASGLMAHRDLLRRTYSDVVWIEGKSDKARYTSLVATIGFLYAVSAFGTLVG